MNDPDLAVNEASDVTSDDVTALIQPSSSLRQWLRTRCANLAGMGVVIMAMMFLAGLFAELHWWCHLALQLRWQIMIGTLLSSAVLLVVGRRWWATAGLAQGVVIGLLLAPWWAASVSSLRPSAESSNLRLIAANVLSINPSPDQYLQWISEQQADMVVVQEITSAWLPVLAPLMASHPHRLVLPRRDNYGIALFSRLPLRDIRRHEFVSGVPAIVAHLHHAGREIMVIGTHTYTPMSRDSHDGQVDHINGIMDYIQQAAPHLTGDGAKDGMQVVLAGDFNMTPWSPQFADLQQQTGLQAVPGGMWATWNAFGVPGLGLPIDHVLHSAGLTAVNRQLGPFAGSDHRPVLVDMVW